MDRNYAEKSLLHYSQGNQSYRSERSELSGVTKDTTKSNGPQNAQAGSSFSEGYSMVASSNNTYATTSTERLNQYSEHLNRNAWFQHSQNYNNSAVQAMWNPSATMPTRWNAQQGPHWNLNQEIHPFFGGTGRNPVRGHFADMCMGYAGMPRAIPNAFTGRNMIKPNSGTETFHRYQTWNTRTALNQGILHQYTASTGAHFPGGGWVGMPPSLAAVHGETAVQDPDLGDPKKRKAKWSRKQRKNFRFKKIMKARKRVRKEKQREMRVDSECITLENSTTDDSDNDTKDTNNNPLNRTIYWKPLPWYLYPLSACWVCRQCIQGDWRKHKADIHRVDEVTSANMIEWVYLVNGLLWTICRILKLKDICGMVQYARKKGLQGKPFLSKYEINLMNFFERANGIENREFSKRANPVNCAAALICGAVIRSFMEKMTDEECSQIAEERMMDYSGKPVDPNTDVGLPGLVSVYPTAADTHLQMDRLFIRTEKKSYTDAVTRLPEPRSIIMDLVIGSFSLPDTWPDQNAILALTEQDPKLKFAIGWNPLWSRIPENGLLQKFRQLLSVGNVVAVGVIGLHYTDDTTPNDRLVQRTLLGKILPIVFCSQLPVIVHCKEAKEESGKQFCALGDCINLMKRVLPQSYPVYISGFNADKKAYRQWLKHFPNAVFGISPVILDLEKMHKGLEEVIEVMPKWRLLLETRAPVFTPKFYFQEGLLAHQDLLADVAEKVASIKLTHKTFMMHDALEAARDFFNI